ncbi:cobalamin biosynthesis protein CbiG [Niveispirillum sp. SYP-B3756]|nr:cobalamin biosynthesis protein CbiG [Niveispirillum sp. SYP-B3756]
MALGKTMVGRPLIAGIGCRRGTSLAALSSALNDALANADRTRADLTALASWTGKGDEPGLLALAEGWGLPLHLLDSDTLTAQPVSQPSAAVTTLTGLPSVAEAAALAIAGPNARPLLPRHVAGGVVVALVEGDKLMPEQHNSTPEARP